MTNRAKAFSGRLFIDHQSKTGGTAVSSWLRNTLGDGVVTPNIVESHRTAVRRYGGIYSIISGHTDFKGEGFDPRYQYLTLLREPVDRVVSWLFYAINDTPDTSNYQLKQACQTFLDSEGKIVPEEIKADISNIYTNHFSQIFRNPHAEASTNDQLMGLAIDALKEYEILGLFEQMPQYLADVADLIGIPHPESIAKVNVTSKRPQVSEISNAFRARIIELNSLDIQVYETVRAWKEVQWQTLNQRVPRMTVPLWDKYNLPPDRMVISDAIILGRAGLRQGYDINYGEPITFDVNIFLTRNLKDLNMGIVIYDADMRRAFGTNSALLNQVHKHSSMGSHRVTYDLIVHLPEGKYSIGFACTELLSSGSRDLLWYDKLCEFEVFHPSNRVSVGYANLSSSMSFLQTDLGLEDSVVNHPVGNLKVIEIVNSMRTNEKIFLDVVVQNCSAERWLNGLFRPINLSYHWLDKKGKPIVVDGERTKLPRGCISQGQSVQSRMTVLAPQEPGDYILFLTLVQENCAWFESFGNDFKPALIEVRVS